eukprot:1655847-Rhodomonas_salina.2
MQREVPRAFILQSSLCSPLHVCASDQSWVTGRMWTDIHRPRVLTEDAVTVEKEPLFTGEGTQRVDGRQQALEEGQTDPVQIWADSRFECWWPRERLTAIGLKEVELPMDGNGGFRHVRSILRYIDTRRGENAQMQRHTQTLADTYRREDARRQTDTVRREDTEPDAQTQPD